MRKGEWLPQAKRLAVGMREHIFHLRENRPNLVIGNDPDKFWCYCHSCKCGGVEQKGHVVLGKVAPVESTNTVVPTDLMGLDDLVVGRIIGEFLAEKNMDFMYFVNPTQVLKYSPSRRRLIVNAGGGVYGRDLTGASYVKWLTYKGQNFVTTPNMGWEHPSIVLVEDLFSYFKVRWALRDEPYMVVCALGTNPSDHIMKWLVDSHPGSVLWMFDGDPAGHRGAYAGNQRAQSLGLVSVAACAPLGYDPKDMSIQAIREHIMYGVRNG